MKDITKRLLVAAVGIPVGILLIWLGDLYFLALILIISSIGIWEFYEIAGKKNIHLPWTYGISINMILLITAYINIEYSMFYYLIPLEILMFYLFSVIESVFSKKNNSAEIIGFILLGMFYVTFGFMSMLFIREYLSGGFYLFLTLIISIWVCDSAAYFTGITIGKHKLWERISPKKTWEGAIGGFIGAVGSIFVLNFLFDLNYSVPEKLLIGFIVGIAGQFGDLFESKLKRDVAIKDSSNLIPGHGGILDRFDSLLFVAPVIMIYFIILRY